MSHYWRHYDCLRDEYGVRVVEEPTVEPISIEEARSHLRIHAFGSPDEHPDDGQIMNVYLPAAREWCEAYSGKFLAEQTVEMSMLAFPSRASTFYLPIGPVHSITSVVYLDVDGVETTMTETTDYLTRIYNGRAAVYLPDDVQWPTTLPYNRNWNAAEPTVFVRYVAGYTTLSPDEFPLPRSARAAILLVLGHLYENRENSALLGRGDTLTEIPLGAQRLLDKDRVRMGFA